MNSRIKDKSIIDVLDGAVKEVAKNGKSTLILSYKTKNTILSPIDFTVNIDAIFE